MSSLASSGGLPAKRSHADGPGSAAKAEQTTEEASIGQPTNATTSATSASATAAVVKAEPIDGRVGPRAKPAMKTEHEKALEGSSMNLLMDLVLKTFFVDSDVVVFEHVNRSGFVLVKDLVNDLLLPEENIRKSLNELRKNKLIESFCTHCEKSSDCDCKESVKNEQKAEAEANRQASVNNAKQQKRAIVLKFYYVNEEQFYDITKIRVNELRSRHGEQTVEFRCPNCSQDFTAEDTPELRRNNNLHCGTFQVVRVEREELSSRQEALMQKISRTVAPIERLWRQIDKDTLHDSHPLTSGRKKFIRQWENVAFALQWISVDDLNHKDQNDVIHALSTMNDEDDYSQLFVEMTHAYKPFDLEQAKQDEIEDPTFIPIFLREGSITNQKITPYQKFIRREDRRRRDAALNRGKKKRPENSNELAALIMSAQNERKVRRSREYKQAARAARERKIMAERKAKKEAQSQ